MDKPILASGQMLSVGQLAGSDGFNLSQQQLPASFVRRNHLYDPADGNAPSRALF